MSEKKTSDREYLYLSAMLKAREANMLTRDKLERILSAGSFDDAAKLLQESGWPDMTGLSASGVDKALSARREELFSELVGISASDDYALNAGVDYHLGADAAGLVRDIYRSAFYAVTECRDLDDRVLFGVERSAKLMSFARRHVEFFSKAATLFGAVWDTSWCPIIARSYDVTVFYDDRAYVSSETGGTLSGKFRHLHEVFVPRKPFVYIVMHFQIRSSQNTS